MQAPEVLWPGFPCAIAFFRPAGTLCLFSPWRARHRTRVDLRGLCKRLRLGPHNERASPSRRACLPIHRGNNALPVYMVGAINDFTVALLFPPAVCHHHLVLSIISPTEGVSYVCDANH